MMCCLVVTCGLDEGVFFGLAKPLAVAKSDKGA